MRELRPEKDAADLTHTSNAPFADNDGFSVFAGEENDKISGPKPSGLSERELHSDVRERKTERTDEKQEEWKWCMDKGGCV